MQDFVSFCPSWQDHVLFRKTTRNREINRPRNSIIYCSRFKFCPRSRKNSVVSYQDQNYALLDVGKEGNFVAKDLWNLGEELLQIAQCSVLDDCRTYGQQSTDSHDHPPPTSPEAQFMNVQFR